MLALRSLREQKLWGLLAISRGFVNMSSKSENRLVWVDLEMTGLDVNTCHIIEMACIITDENLNVVAEAPDLVIHQPEEVLSAMGEWCQKHHGESGLTAAVRASNVTLNKAEDIMLEFVQMHTPKQKCPLAGNSIHADKRFLDKYMPRFMNHLHYRIVDVSTVKELCRALDDIKESIEELKHYRKTIFKQPFYIHPNAK